MSRVSRRVVVRGLAVAVTPGLAGCTLEGDGAAPAQDGSSDPVSPDPDVALAITVLSEETAALAALQATRSLHRELGRELSPMIASHRAHVSLLSRAAPEGSLPRASSRRFAVPDNERAARLTLVVVEQDLGSVQKRAAAAAKSGAFARLLASMTASSAQHAALLTAEAGDRDAGGAA
jgi:hypothetical protein